MTKPLLFMGCDVGTGGVRVSICDQTGELISSASVPFMDGEVSGLPEGWHEQRPESWIQASTDCIVAALQELQAKGFHVNDIHAIAVDSTSGTIIPLDENNRTLLQAIMYNDGRAEQEARQLNEIAADFINKMGYRFAASFALAKILWIKNNRSQIYDQTRTFVHACDYMNGFLTGNFHISDFSNALKTGYDIAEYQWPSFIAEKLGISLDLLPRVVKPGEVIGHISTLAAQQTGLPESCLVCAGMTDSNAAFVATGAAASGDWFTTIGTTLVVKGITEKPLKDMNGVIYCHRHPDGMWLPGAAGNVGGECLAVKFKGRDYKVLDAAAQKFGGSNLIIYPLVRKGERFPFVNPIAAGFILGVAKDEIDLYRGYLEGVALTEKLGYEVLERLGAQVGESLYTGGGGSNSPVWLHIRADVLEKAIVKPKYADASLGCAILAASRTYYTSLVEAAQTMVKLEEPVQPNLKGRNDYQEKYELFKKELMKRGYLMV